MYLLMFEFGLNVLAYACLMSFHFSSTLHLSVFQHIFPDSLVHEHTHRHSTPITSYLGVTPPPPPHTHTHTPKDKGVFFQPMWQS